MSDWHNQNILQYQESILQILEQTTDFLSLVDKVERAVSGADLITVTKTLIEQAYYSGVTPTLAASTLYFAFIKAYSEVFGCFEDDVRH